MQVAISIKKDNGEMIEIVKDVKNVEDTNIIDSMEAQMLSIRREVFPLLSEQLVEQHQKGGQRKKK
jgi:hypothetical protein